MSRVVPARIGRFEIERLLDSNPHVTAYFARDTRLGRPVIVKKLTVSSAAAQTRGHIDRLLAGARARWENCRIPASFR